METSVVSISPEQAIRMLATNKENNRSLKERTVNYYAHQMMNGQWRMQCHY